MFKDELTTEFSSKTGRKDAIFKFTGPKSSRTATSQFFLHVTEGVSNDRETPIIVMQAIFSNSGPEICSQKFVSRRYRDQRDRHPTLCVCPSVPCRPYPLKWSGFSDKKLGFAIGNAIESLKLDQNVTFSISCH